MTTDHLRPVLDTSVTCICCQMGEQLATAHVPPGIPPPWKIDCIAEAVRGRERNRCWGRNLQVGGPNNGSTTQQGSGSSDGPSPVCPLHKGRDRVRGTCSSGPPEMDPQTTITMLEALMEMSRGSQALPHQIFLQPSFPVFVGR